MAKISIEEALRTKLELPWKSLDKVGYWNYAVIRRRPEDLTKELFDQLRQYGLGVAQIRELFYINSNDWNKIADKLGIEKGKRGPKAASPVTKDAIKASQAIAETMVNAGNGPRLAEAPTDKLPKDAMAEAPETESTATSTAPTLPETKSTNQENVDIHQPTRQEVETFFGVGDNPPLDFSGWETFDLSKSFIRPRALITGTTKLYIGVGVKFIKDWDRCCVKVRPDGKQIALEKVIDAGYKVGKDHQRPAITCRKATEMLCKIVGNGAEYLPIIEQEGLLVFEYRGGQ